MERHLEDIYKSAWRILIIAAVVMWIPQPSLSSPVYLRVTGGVTNAMQGTVWYDAHTAVPILGVGVGLELAPRHMLFLDIEYSHRKSDEYLRTRQRVPGLMFEPSPPQSLLYVPVTLGYRLTISHPANRISVFLATGATAGMSRRDLGKGIEYPPMNADDYGMMRSDQSNIESRWRLGFIGGMGYSVKVNSRFRITGTGLYRYLLDHQPYYNSLLGGLEGEIALEIRL